MDEIFGLSTLTVMWIVVAIVGVAVGIMAVIWLRKPVLARMGIRNMQRRRAQTALIVLGADDSDDHRDDVVRDRRHAGDQY